MKSISRLLGLSPEETRRAVPFFGVYFLLFTALTIADGVAVSLFASRIGADSLPLWYSITAVLSLAVISAYLTQVSRHSAGVLFGWILGGTGLVFLTAWVAYRFRGGTFPLGTLFVTREIALTMILMHFGTFLQDYFLRSELNRLLPIIYAGGRVGGIIGGGLLSGLAERLGPVNLVPAVAGIFLVAWILILRIGRNTPHCEEPDEPPGTQPPAAASAGGASVDGPSSSGAGPPQGELPYAGDPPQAALQQRAFAVRRFLKQVAELPLLRWLTLTTVLFIICRWFLVYQYTSFFESHFADEARLAAFLGRYTQIALVISLVLQLFVVGRLVGRIGVSSTHLIYSVMVCGGLLGNLFIVALPLAVLSRFLESELRFGLRNPVNQMMVNRFPKRTRIVVRGWSLGWLIPAGTLVASAVIAGLVRFGGPAAVSIVGVAVGALFVASAAGVGRAYDRFDERTS